MQKNKERVKTRDDSTKNATLHKNISNRTTTVGDRKILFFICLFDREQFIFKNQQYFFIASRIISAAVSAM